MYPPVLDFALHASIAARMSSFCMCEQCAMSTSSLDVFTDASFEMTPVPLHGASNNTRSKPLIFCKKKNYIKNYLR